MSKKISYKTVKRISESMIVEKKSKFIASVFPVDNEPDALSFLARVKSKYPDATHHVYAYIIDENNIFRYTDDGEPSGTAGMPVLDTIRKEGLVDVLVVVTRYFGGTLLGTGGLVRAYTQATQAALEEAQVATMTLMSVLEIRTDYNAIGKIKYMFTQADTLIMGEEYGVDVAVTIAVPVLEKEAVQKKIIEATNGKAEIEEKEQIFMAV